MFPKWLLLASLFKLLEAVTVCDPILGSAIRGVDCAWALAILEARLTLSNPRDLHFENNLHAFALNSGDPRYSMPQGASFGSCGIGIDIAPTAQATASWAALALRIRSLMSTCSIYGLGGTDVFGLFTVMIVDTGQGMRNLAGTCMSPNSSNALPLLWQMTERLCGFQTLAPLILPPDTSRLPAPPMPFPTGLNVNNPTWPQYRARGQWIRNANAWSPILGNALDQPHARAMWILLTRVGPQRSFYVPRPPFSGTVPRVLGAAWIHRQTDGLRLPIGAAWGAHAANWMPLTGDLSNLQLFIDSFDWLLIVLGQPDQAEGMPIPARQARIPMPGFGYSPRPLMFRPIRNPELNVGQTRVPTTGSRAMGLGGRRYRVETNLTAATRLDPAQATRSAEGSQQTAGTAGAAADIVGDNPSITTISEDANTSNRSDAPMSSDSDSHGSNQPPGPANNPLHLY